MKTHFARLFPFLILCGITTLAQTGRGRSTQSPRRASTQATTEPESPSFFQTESYSVRAESVKRKANNFTVTLVFESRSNEVVKVSWGGYPHNAYVPYLVDEHSKKYL